MSVQLSCTNTLGFDVLILKCQTGLNISDTAYLLASPREFCFKAGGQHHLSSDCLLSRLSDTFLFFTCGIITSQPQQNFFSCVEGYEQRWELQSVKHPWTSMLLCTLFTLGTRWKGRRANYNPGCPSKMKKKSSWSPSPHWPGNLKPGVGSQRGIQGEEQCGSLCKRGRENKPFPLERDHVQAPSEKTTQGRSEPFLHCTRPHTRAQLNMHSIVKMEGWSEMLYTKHLPKATHYPVIVILFGPRQKSTTVFCVLCLSWDSMAICSGFQAVCRPSATLAGW